MFFFFFKANCTEGDVRLVNGGSNYQGVVEICHNNAWGTVCDDHWDDNDGMVVCRQLGFEYVSIATRESFGQGGGYIWLDDVSCSGSEARLIDCGHRGFGVHSCSRYLHNGDASVRCEGNYIIS